MPNDDSDTSCRSTDSPIAHCEKIPPLPRARRDHVGLLRVSRVLSWRSQQRTSGLKPCPLCRHTARLKARPFKASRFRTLSSWGPSKPLPAIQPDSISGSPFLITCISPLRFHVEHTNRLIRRLAGICIACPTRNRVCAQGDTDCSIFARTININHPLGPKVKGTAPS